LPQRKVFFLIWGAHELFIVFLLISFGLPGRKQYLYSYTVLFVGFRAWLFIPKCCCKTVGSWCPMDWGRMAAHGGIGHFEQLPLLKSHCPLRVSAIASKTFFSYMLHKMRPVQVLKSRCQWQGRLLCGLRERRCELVQQMLNFEQVKYVRHHCR
jgi:hypothetical protein